MWLIWKLLMRLTHARFVSAGSQGESCPSNRGNRPCAGWEPDGHDRILISAIASRTESPDCVARIPFEPGGGWWRAAPPTLGGNAGKCSRSSGDGFPRKRSACASGHGAFRTRSARRLERIRNTLDKPGFPHLLGQLRQSKVPPARWSSSITDCGKDETRNLDFRNPKLRS